MLIQSSRLFKRLGIDASSRLRSQRLKLWGTTIASLADHLAMVQLVCTVITTFGVSQESALPSARVQTGKNSSHGGPAGEMECAPGFFLVGVGFHSAISQWNGIQAFQLNESLVINHSILQFSCSVLNNTCSSSTSRVSFLDRQGIRDECGQCLVKASPWSHESSGITQLFLHRSA